MSKFMDINEKIAEGVTEGYQKIEDGVVGGYKKIEDAVVDGFSKITDKFVDTFLTKEGESLEQAKARVAAEQQAREEERKAEQEQRAAAQKEMIDASLEASRNAGKHI